RAPGDAAHRPAHDDGRLRGDTDAIARRHPGGVLVGWRADRRHRRPRSLAPDDRRRAGGATAHRRRDDDLAPSWSPDGRQIAFLRMPPRSAPPSDAGVYLV